MELEQNYLICESNIDAYIDTNIEKSTHEVHVLDRLRSQRHDISLSEVETAKQNGTGIYLLTLDSTDLQKFFIQLDELLSLARSIEGDKLPVRLVESYLDRIVSTKMIEDSIVFHRSHEFSVSLSISAFLYRLEIANWFESSPVQLGSDCKTVNKLPNEFGRFSEMMFVVAHPIRQRMDEADYHTDTVAHGLRVVSVLVENLVHTKFHGTNLPEHRELVSLISTIVKWACIQLFYEPDGGKEFVHWCDLICNGYLPVGWEGTAANGTLLLYKHCG